MNHLFTGCLPASIPRQVFAGCHDPALDRRYQQLTLKDVNLGHVGRHAEDDDIHSRVRDLRPGAPLTLRPQGESYLLLNQRGQGVGRTARSFEPGFSVERCEVADIVVRYREEGSEEHWGKYPCQRWEVVVPRICGMPG